MWSLNVVFVSNALKISVHSFCFAMFKLISPISSLTVVGISKTQTAFQIIFQLVQFLFKTDVHMPIKYIFFSCKTEKDRHLCVINMSNVTNEMSYSFCER